MALSGFKKEETKEMSMIEISFELMRSEKKPFLFKDLVKRVAKIKGMNENEVMERISFLYTDLNVDGRFISLGENRWGLRKWYPYEQAEEEITQTVRRKKAKKAADDKAAIDLNAGFDDVDEVVEDEFEDLEDELDELVSEEDDDDDDDDDEIDVKHDKGIDLDIDSSDTDEDELDEKDDKGIDLDLDIDDDEEDEDKTP